MQASFGICRPETTWRKSCPKKLCLCWQKKSWFHCVTASRWARQRETSTITPPAASGDPTHNVLLFLPRGGVLGQTYSFLSIVNNPNFWLKICMALHKMPGSWFYSYLTANWSKGWRLKGHIITLQSNEIAKELQNAPPGCSLPMPGLRPEFSCVTSNLASHIQVGPQKEEEEDKTGSQQML